MKPSIRFILSAFILLNSFYSVAQAVPVLVSQELVKARSSIRFGVESPSPSLQMSGAFSKFSGFLDYDPVTIENSKVRLILDLKSAQLPPDQLLQSIFLQTAVAHLKQQEATFTSNKIVRTKGSQYLVHGIYTWQGKNKTTSVPIQFVRTSDAESEILVLLDGTPKDKTAPSELGGIDLNGTRGWAKGRFIFKKG